jgi:hypothetical protein
MFPYKACCGDGNEIIRLVVEISHSLIVKHQVKANLLSFY